MNVLLAGRSQGILIRTVCRNMTACAQAAVAPVRAVSVGLPSGAIAGRLKDHFQGHIWTFIDTGLLNVLDPCQQKQINALLHGWDWHTAVGAVSTGGIVEGVFPDSPGGRVAVSAAACLPI